MGVGHVNELGDDLGDIGNRWHSVRVERAGEDRARRRVDDPFLGERVPDPLDDSALDLALRSEPVDHATDIVDGDDLVDANLSRLDVHRHFRDLDAERQHLHAGGIRAPCSLTQDLSALQ